MTWSVPAAPEALLPSPAGVAPFNTSRRGATHMGDRIFTLADTSADEVTGVLKATGSTDADVLFAATSEFGRPFRNQKVFGFAGIALGAVLGLTVVLVAAGIPLAIAGVWLWHKGNRNAAVIASAYTAYMASLTSAAAAARLSVPPLNGPAKTG